MAETGKQRAGRMPLDYYKAPNLVEAWKGRLGWAAFVVTLGWLGAGALLSKGEAHFGASPGRVADPHGAWDHNCAACHDCCSPISSHSFALPGMSHSTNQKCQACHAGPAHHEGQKPDLNCAACHRDHQGPGHSLVNLPDADCTQCHKSLASHGKKLDFADVSVFATGKHPTFRSLKSDPGKLKFNHALHMTAGLPIKGGGELMKLKDIPDEYRKRYEAMQEKNGKEDFVQLACASCHQLDAADFKLAGAAEREVSPATRPPRGSGEYFQPITYENQCKACHPLEVSTTDKAGKLTHFEVPHRVQPDGLERLLKDYFVAQAVAGEAGFFEMKVKRPLPGKKIEDLLTPELRKLVDMNVERATGELYKLPAKKNCSLCHEVKHDGKPWTIVPPDVPQVWLKHARFDHMAHRAVDCRQCHGGAETSTKEADVLIPNMDNCVKCHAPLNASAATGGARFNCTECHSYHHRANPMAGRGAAARSAPHPTTYDMFLRGTPK